MALIRCLFVCDGCGKTHEMSHFNEPPPTGWLLSPPDNLWQTSGNRWDAGPWNGGVAACSADCVATAKENVKRHAQAAVDRFKARIDAVKLERS